MVPADASRQVPVVQVELDSCAELEREDNFVSSRSLEMEMERRRDEVESETGTEAASIDERRAMIDRERLHRPSGTQFALISMSWLFAFARYLHVHLSMSVLCKLMFCTCSLCIKI